MKQAFVRGEEYYFVTAPNLGFKADWSSVIRLTLAFLDVRFSKPPTTVQGLQHSFANGSFREVIEKAIG